MRFLERVDRWLDKRLDRHVQAAQVLPLPPRRRCRVCTTLLTPSELFVCSACTSRTSRTLETHGDRIRELLASADAVRDCDRCGLRVWPVDGEWRHRSGYTACGMDEVPR